MANFEILFVFNTAGNQDLPSFDLNLNLKLSFIHTDGIPVLIVPCNTAIE